VPPGTAPLGVSVTH